MQCVKYPHDYFYAGAHNFLMSCSLSLIYAFCFSPIGNWVVCLGWEDEGKCYGPIYFVLRKWVDENDYLLCGLWALKPLSRDSP